MSEDYKKIFAQAYEQEQKKKDLNQKAESKESNNQEQQDENVNNTDDIYKSKPAYRNNDKQRGSYYKGESGDYYNNSYKRGGSYNPRGNRGRGYAQGTSYRKPYYKDQNNQIDEENGDEVQEERKYNYRGRGSYQKNDSYGVNRGGPYRGNYRGRGGNDQDFKEFRETRGGYNNYRGNYRGGRGGYKNHQDEQVEYQSNNEDNQSYQDSLDEETPDALSSSQLEFIDSKTSAFRDKLKGIVNEKQIEQKCINLEFDSEKFDQWVTELTQVDKRVAGLKDFEWNETVTADQKRVQRAKKLKFAKNEEKRQEQKKIKQEEYEKKQKEYEEIKAQRLLEKQQKQEEYLKKKQEKLEQQKVKKAQEDEKKQEEDNEVKNEEEVTENTENRNQDTDLRKKKNDYSKTPQQPVYQVKQKNTSQNKYQPKQGQTHIFRQKQKTSENEQPAQKVENEKVEVEDENDDNLDYDQQDDYPGYGNDEYDIQDPDEEDEEELEEELLQEAANQQRREEEQRLKEEKLRKEEQAKKAAEAEALKKKQEAEQKAAQLQKEKEEKLQQDLEKQKKQVEEQEKLKLQKQEEEDQKKREADAQLSQQNISQFPGLGQNSLGNNPFLSSMMPMMGMMPLYQQNLLGNANEKSVGDQSSSAQNQQQFLLEQQQLYYQQMLIHQQMAQQLAQQYQATQMVLQQQLLNQGLNPNANQSSGQLLQGQQLNGQTAGLNPLQQSQFYPQFSGFPGSLGLLPGQYPPLSGLPVQNGAASSTQDQNLNFQQQFMPMMPMMYPQQPLLPQNGLNLAYGQQSAQNSSQNKSEK